MGKPSSGLCEHPNGSSVSRRAVLPSPVLHGGTQEGTLVSAGVLQLPGAAQHPITALH